VNLIIMQNHGTSLHQTLKSYSYANAGVPRTEVEKKDDIKCIQMYKLYVLVWLLKTVFFQNTNFKWKKIYWKWTFDFSKFHNIMITLFSSALRGEEGQQHLSYKPHSPHFLVRATSESSIIMFLNVSNSRR